MLNGVVTMVKQPFLNYNSVNQHHPFANQAIVSLLFVVCFMLLNSNKQLGILFQCNSVNKKLVPLQRDFNINREQQFDMRWCHVNFDPCSTC